MAATAKRAAVAVIRSLARLAIAALAGCSFPEGELTAPIADQAMFRDQVYPVLLRDCAFANCHGNHQRFFAVFGPGRVRLDAKTPIYDPPTDDELAITYTRALSMLDPSDPASSLLLRKPIPISQGGAGHKGDDVWGRSVYRTTNDARYGALHAWGMTVK